MADLNRYVIGLDDDGNSTVVHTGVPNQQEQAGLFWRSTLWKTKETPVDNTVPGDRSIEGGATRSPFPGGMLVRCLELWPDPDPETHQKMFEDVNRMAGHTGEVSEAARQRSATMHKTDTLDVISCIRGEIYLVLDDGEVLMEPGDTVIITGVNHGWSNRSTEPCLLIGTMTDAVPRS